MICDVCAAEKPATIALDTSSLVSLATTPKTVLMVPAVPFTQPAYDIDETKGDEATWRVIGPGPRVVCSEVCYQKLVSAAPALPAMPEPPPAPLPPPLVGTDTPPEWVPQDPGALVGKP
jgi:hypothetical protein